MRQSCNYIIMKYSRSLLLLLAVVSLAFFGCKKEDPDTEKPVITSATVNGVDHDIEVNAGATAAFQLTITDNKNLKQWKLDMHDDFDSHSHGKTLVNTPFSTINIYEISGTSVTSNQTITIAADAASGPYHAVLTALDAEGNESNFVELEINVVQTGQPVITVTNPDLSAENHLHHGDTIHMAGTITDDVDLEEILISLEEGGAHAHGKTGEAPLYEQEWDLTGSSDTSWDFSTLVSEGKEIIIPAGAETGTYELVIVAKDSDGNYTIVEGEDFEID